MTAFESSIKSLLEGLLPTLKSPIRKVVRDRESGLCIATQAPITTDPRGVAKFKFGLETIYIGKYQPNGRVLPFARVSETKKDGLEFQDYSLRENENFILSNWSKVGELLKEKKP